MIYYKEVYYQWAIFDLKDYYKILYIEKDK